MIQLAAAAALSWLALAGPRPVPVLQADATAATRPWLAALPADLAASIPHAGARVQEPDRWFAQDKVLHFTASLGAAAIVGAAGLWKEWRDRRRGAGFSARDLVWDGLGIVAGLAVAANTR